MGSEMCIRDRITIISHSLGAEVACNLLFNDNENAGFATPKQNIEVCLVAPAISKKKFKNYYNRNKENHFVDSDNYRLTVIYNELDFVLSKTSKILGIRISFSRIYGNTRLGCNCGNEAYELEKYFKKHFPFSLIHLIHASSFGSSHHSLSYFGSNEFREFIIDKY